MSDSEASATAVDPSTNGPSFRDPTGDQVLQLGLLAWGIFTALVLIVSFGASVLAGSDVGESVASAGFAAVISAVIGLLAMAMVGVPLGILLTRPLRRITSRALHATAFGAMALVISLAVNCFFWASSLPALIGFTSMSTAATVAAWCIRWVWCVGSVQKRTLKGSTNESTGSRPEESTRSSETVKSD